MGFIDLQKVRAVSGQLLEEKLKLAEWKGQLLLSKQRIQAESYTNQAVVLLAACIALMDEEIESMGLLAGGLEQVCGCWQETEEKIADCYNLDTVRYPRADFAPSRITGFENCSHLLLFGDS